MYETNTKAIDYVEDRDTSEFYPTPENIIEKMVEGIDFSYGLSILEPSAGSGKILKYIARITNVRHYGNRTYDIDAIEIDSNLRQILKYQFSDDRRIDLRKKQKKSYSSKRWIRTTRENKKERSFTSFVLKFLKLIDDTADILYNVCGIRPGDVILISQPNIPEVLLLFYAASKIGAVSNLVHPFTPYNQVMAIMEKTKSKVAFLFEQRVAKEAKSHIFATPRGDPSGEIEVYAASCYQRHAEK